MFKILCVFIFLIQSNLAEVLTSSAYDLKNKLLYKERLFIKRLESGKISSIKTEYIDDSDKVFATLESDFSNSLFVPNSKFTDTRFGLTEIVSFYPDKKIVEVNRMSSKNKKDGTIETSPLFVMGQGFNNFIRENFEKLINEEIVVWFGIAPRVDKFRFSISHLKDKSNQKKILFKIEPDSFVLKAFVSPIVLTYDRETKKLLEFQGLSNIDDSKGNSQEVIIRYDY